MFSELSEGAKQLLAEIMLAEASTPMVLDSSSPLVFDHHNRLESYLAIALECFIPRPDRFLEDPESADPQKTRKYIYDIVDRWLLRHTSTIKDLKMFLVSKYQCYIQEILEWEADG